MIVALYADGGVVSKNPSPIGGTWAWRHVDEDGNVVAEEASYIEPCDMLGAGTKVTNNQTEFLALVMGLEALPEGWSGNIYSDSKNAITRLFASATLNNLPMWLIGRGADAVQRIKHAHVFLALKPGSDLVSPPPNTTLRVVLLDGHPNRSELVMGRSSRGRLVSEHNVWCDKACGIQAERLKKKLEEVSSW